MSLKEYVINISKIPVKVINNVMYRFIFDESTGAKFLIMRIVEVPPGEKVPLHSHDDEEQAYLILEGEGIIRLGDKSYHVKAGHAVFIPMHTPHGVLNNSNKVLKYVLFCAKTR